MGKFTDFFTSIDNLLSEEKEQKLKAKLAKKIKSKIFTEEILEKLNEHDFTGIADEEEDIVMIFSTIFPIFVKKDGIVFRLYKHKIEVDLSDEMKDRYIYMFSDGRLTSGLFQCFNISDDEYVYGIKRIIEVIPVFNESILETLSTYNKNISSTYVNNNLKPRIELSEKNYNKLIEYLEEGIEVAYKGEMIPIHVVDLKEADEKIKKYSYRSFDNLLEIKKYFKGE